MGKLKDLASVKSTNAESFAYLPPDTAFDAMRILVKPHLGYLAQPPATVSMDVLGAVLRGLRRASPLGRIVIMEGVNVDRPAREVFHQLGVTQLLDHEMRLTDTDNLVMFDYANTNPAPKLYEKMTASEYIKDYDCVISVGAFKRTMVDGTPQISASLKNLLGFFPREPYREQFVDAPLDSLLSDVYFTIGQYVHGAVIDLTHKYASDDARPDRDDVAVPVGKVVWGDDLLAVDEVACKIADEPVPVYIQAIRQLRKQLSS